MNNVSSVLLSDTLKLIQLARETARIQGQPEQAEKLKPVVDQLKTLAEGSNRTNAMTNTTKTPPPSAPASGSILAQDDFKTLLAAVQKHQNQPPQSVSPAALRPTSSLERNQIVVSMASGGMNALEIARQMGMTIDEVNLVIRLHQKSTESRKEVSE